MQVRPAVLFVILILLTACGGGGSQSSSTGSGKTTGGGSNNPPSSGGGTGTTTASCSALSTGQGASLSGFVPFPSDNAWNQDISAATVDPNSNAIITDIGSAVAVHADFGSGQYNGSDIGIPYVVVDGTQALVPITFNAYGDESDPGPMPIPSNASIEGDPNPGSGDRHVLVLDKGNCFLYELYGAYPGTGGKWSAGSAAVWDMTLDEQRPLQWTSADAAGLPIFPGLARYDEVAAGSINHALRFTLQHSRAAFIPPASHWAANTSDTLAAPMGMRMRLKSSFDISGYSPANQVILTALKKYGMIMADNGSSMYISGAPDSRWDNNDLHQLGNLHASDFEVLQMNPVFTASNLPAGAAPAISSFTATPTTTTSSGTVALNWSVSGASYIIVSPQVGAVRGTTVTVTPGQTTTYTLYASDAYGQTTATATVSVP
jgi:hypothetical protein